MSKKRKRNRRPPMRDLPAAEARTPDVKGGSLGGLVKSIGSALGAVVKGVA